MADDHLYLESDKDNFIVTGSPDDSDGSQGGGDDGGDGDGDGDGGGDGGYY